MYEDILYHIKTSTKREYFPNDYNHFVQAAYLMIAKCIRENASTIKLNSAGYILVKGKLETVIFGFDDKVASENDKATLLQTNRVALEKILERDILVQKYTRIVTNTAEELTIEFIEPTT